MLDTNPGSKRKLSIGQEQRRSPKHKYGEGLIDETMESGIMCVSMHSAEEIEEFRMGSINSKR